MSFKKLVLIAQIKSPEWFDVIPLWNYIVQQVNPQLVQIFLDCIQNKRYKEGSIFIKYDNPIVKDIKKVEKQFQTNIEQKVQSSLIDQLNLARIQSLNPFDIYDME